MIFTVPDLPFANSQTTEDHLQYTQTDATVVCGGAFSEKMCIIEDINELPGTSQVNRNQTESADFPEWTPKMEAKFLRLTERKAANQIDMAERVEFEKMAALRRQLRNPRSGEEIIAEYEQRMLTKKLVEALTHYVDFHRQHASSHSR